MFDNYYRMRGDEAEDFSLGYRLYAADKSIEDNSDQSYLNDNAEAYEQMISELLKESDDQLDDGSVGGDVFRTAVYTANMCIASRVYETVDPIFARDGMHTALDAGRYLMGRLDGKNSQNETSDDSTEKAHIQNETSNDTPEKAPLQDETQEMEAVLWAFAELLRTDVEIRNAYDHSMMAGMPQKMSRQKKYKMIVNRLTAEVFEKDEMNDLKLLTAIAVLYADSESVPSESIRIISDKLSKYADLILEEKIEADDAFKNAVVVTTLAAAKLELENDEGDEANGSQLIKVIEYNVLNEKKKKLSEDERNLLTGRIADYERYLNNL